MHLFLVTYIIKNKKSLLDRREAVHNLIMKKLPNILCCWHGFCLTYWVVPSNMFNERLINKILPPSKKYCIFIQANNTISQLWAPTYKMIVIRLAKICRLVFKFLIQCQTDDRLAQNRCKNFNTPKNTSRSAMMYQNVQRLVLLNIQVQCVSDLICHPCYY